MELHPEAIPTSEQITETLVDRIYHPHKGKVWALGILLILGVIAFLAVREQKRSALDARWTDLSLASAPPAAGETIPPEVRLERLRAVVEKYGDDPVTDYARAEIVRAHIVAEDFAAAEQELEVLRKRAPKSPLNTVTLQIRRQGSPESIGNMLASALSAHQEWVKDATYEHRWPSEERRALVETNLGSLWIGFYGDDAPAHVAAFVENAKKGLYNQTQVDEIRRTRGENEPQFIQMGNLASTDWTDPKAHDDENPLKTIDPEDSRYKIQHRYRIVSAVQELTGESSSRFMIVTAKDGMPRFDRRNTPIGAVLTTEKSLETLDAIAAQATYATSPDTRVAARAHADIQNHPYPYVYVRRLSIHGAAGLEPGHTWPDGTDRVGTAEPEPWEAELPLAWTPASTTEKDPDSSEDSDSGTESPTKDDGDDAADEEDDEGSDEDPGKDK